MDLTRYMDALEARAIENIKKEDGDYIKDGLLHCGKCNTPKQCRVVMFGHERTPPCLCKCRIEQRDREESERKREAFEANVKRLRQSGFPDSEMEQWTFDHADDPNDRIITAARNYVANFDEFMKLGKGLLFFGTVGTGKTYASACIANALIDKGIPVLMTNFARIANTVSGMWEGKQEYYDSLNRFPLLILDDLATERKTEYMQEIVFNVIDARYRSRLPMIITTNLTSEELKHPSDMAYQRTFSRLLEMCVPVKVEGKDRRLDKLKADIDPMKKLLGLE